MDYLKSFGIRTGEGNYKEEAFYGLILVYNVLFNRIAGHLQSWGLTPAQFNILIIVDKHGKEEGISQIDLSKKLIVTPSNTARLLEKMEQEKLVIRVAMDQDKRVKLVHITPKGSALLEKVWPAYQKKIQESVALLNEADQKKAASLLIGWLDRLVV